jgi:hypothetical protein
VVKRFLRRGVLPELLERSTGFYGANSAMLLFRSPGEVVWVFLKCYLTDRIFLFKNEKKLFLLSFFFVASLNKLLKFNIS